MRCFEFVEEAPTTNAIVIGYKIMDQAKIKHFVKDDHMSPPLA